MLLSAEVLAELCQVYSLGSIISPAQHIAGGLLHQVWCLQTTTGKYALKLHNTHHHQNNNNLLSIAQSQHVAEKMLSQNIPTVGALQHDNQFIYVINNQQYVVLPWIEGRQLRFNKVSNDSIIQIGHIVAKIHQVDFQDLVTETPKWRGLTEAQWRLLIATSQQSYLMDKLPKLVQWSEQCAEADEILSKEMIFSHRDLDDKNVIWHEETPVLLDWEYAGLINPILDILIVALNWSGVQYEKFVEENYNAVLAGYSKNLRGKIEAIHFHAYFGYCLDWLIFVLSNPSQYSDEICGTINAIELVEKVSVNLI